VFLRLLESRTSQSEALASVAEGGQFEEVQRLSASLWILGTIGSSAPFIGLFGTVVGIIKAFQAMAVTGAGGFSVVAAGISEALIATALGLAVAIIALIFYNYFQSRVERVEAALRIHSTRLVEAVANGKVDHGV
jgi:biopolymer transport protein ExbB